MQESPGPREFNTTHWSLVAAARPSSSSPSRVRQALEALCQAYWYPLYAFVRQRGYASEDAEDLTQAFFAHFLEREGFSSADRERGRFRSFLLGSLKHFLAHDWERRRAKKRGGGIAFVHVDALEPEARYALLNDIDASPEVEYHRAWAQEVNDRALTSLRSEFIQLGKGEQFEQLKGSLTGDEPERIETARQLGISEGAVKVAVHRLRKRFRELLRAEIAQTVSDPEDVDDEMRCLVDALVTR